MSQSANQGQEMALGADADLIQVLDPDDEQENQDAHPAAEGTPGEDPAAP